MSDQNSPVETETRAGTEEAKPRTARQRRPGGPRAARFAELKKRPAFTIPGRSARDRVAQWIALKTDQPHLRNKDIAEMLGITAGTLQQYIGEGRKQGWLQFDDPLDKIEHLIIPKTVDNLMEFLNQKDKTVTLETAKGTIFKQYTAAKGIVEGGQNVLALKIEMPTDPGQAPKLVEGQIIGRPKLTE